LQESAKLVPAAPKTVPTTPYSDQRPGTSGLRKKTREFMRANYLENFVQADFDTLRGGHKTGFESETLVIGGDGRYYNRAAIQTIVRIAAANGFGRVLVARGGILSTPAMSAVIRRRRALGGLILSASHNPGGIEEDFGIKYNIGNGGPAPEAVTESIFQQTRKIERYLSLDSPDLDLDRDSVTELAETRVEVFDPLSDYTALMRELFDFDRLRVYFQSGFRMSFNAMHGATGPYARYIFQDLLGAPEGTVLNGVPLEDFGGGHPDPNLIYAAGFAARMQRDDAPALGAACDADGDRNMILGRKIFVTPGDSVALIAEHARTCIPGLRGGFTGVARSLPTSTALDRVAVSLGVPCYETPTGWKYFGSLLDAGLCTICGEESFGTGSVHLREKDGVWAVLCWVSMLAMTNKSVAELVEAHWRRFGRSYFQRHDYEGLDSRAAAEMMSDLQAKLPSLQSRTMAGSTVSRAEDVTYIDPVDHSKTPHAGVRIQLADGSRIVCRLSGTGTAGATLRLYLESYKRDDISQNVGAALQPLADAIRQILDLGKRFGREEPSVIT
jgi:phosphoglucomutase